MQTKMMNSLPFRNKFLKVITSEDLLSAANYAAVYVNGKSQDEACAIIWNLTVNPVDTLPSLGFTAVDPATSSNELEENLTYLPEELITTFRNELRYQYSLVHKDFPKVDVSEKCLGSYNNLLHATVSDTIATAVVFKHCINLLTYCESSMIERAIYLLTSSDEKNAYGGIRSLHFSVAEANFLKPYAKKIGILLNDLYTEKKKSGPATDSPFGALSSLIASDTNTQTCDNSVPEVELQEEAHVSEVESAPVKNKKVVQSTIDINAVVTHHQQLRDFFNVVASLKDLHFDIGLLLEKEEALMSILNGIDNLSISEKS